ncbi:uncharacterized protein CANTADRAFT_6966 [Suhomyces tanzawaensis NRRL Y-17324]|uniref:Interferon-related developmental regulator N-terminal domain-containing protein n=1 Tax=Suhomyces tanzawaensis NRRL Y-17324 TaxID=984487 RepID=A0A1E4SGL7_9ASCO|nr:uncharacterized protein CANTADRAFT_6966 [Suhomyces tanzawaensis NRRL Y-17324]ODV78610.1 hypothetical protein CANTADRAFT_6966 [Suhomyces tanzawaensis NRRL Y-17324]
MPYRNMLLKRWTREDGTPSGSSSRAESRTPMAEDDSDYEEDGESDLQRIQELLSRKLELLQTENENPLNKVHTAGDAKQHAALAVNKSIIESQSTTINDIIASLGLPRTEVSTLSRELLLAQLYKLVVSKPLVVYNEEHQGSAHFVDEEKMQRLVNHFTGGNYRSDVEFLYLFRSLATLIVSNIDDFGEFLSSDFMEQIEKLITEPTTSVITNDNKANLISGYVTLLLVLHHGSSSFGIDDKINWLIDIAEGFSMSALTLRKNVETGDREHSTFFDANVDKNLISEAWGKVAAEVSVAVAALHGIACLLTLLERGDYLNELSEDLMLKLVVLVDNDEIREIAKAAGRVIAVIYESYLYDEDDEDADDEEYNANAPYYEQEALFSIFTRLTNLSSKKVSKKDKKEFNSVFRNILHTLEAYVDSEKRSSIYRKTPEGVELINSIMDSTYIKLSKFKSLSINSWFLYARLRHLRWAFSFGLHNQLVANESIRDILKEPETEFKSYDQYDFDASKLENEQAYAEYASELLDHKHISDDKARSRKIKKERVNKMTAQFEDIELADTK